MEIPKWLSTHLTGEEAKRIEEIVQDAESRTSGEIVPMIVRRSSTIGHVPVILFFAILALFLASDGLTFQEHYLGENTLWIYADMAILAILTNILGRIHLVQRWLTSKEDLIQQVNARAELEFFEANLGKTRDSTGILIFLSIMEHRVVVLADKAIAEKLPASTWQEVVDLVLSGKKSGNLSNGLEKAILKCGELLTPHFPIKHDDTNELHDHLIIKP